MKDFISIILALLAAAVVPSIIFTMPMIIDVPNYLRALYGRPTHQMYLAEYERTARFWYIAFIIALVHAIALGLPGYLLLRRKNLVRWWTSGVCGFVVGCVPAAIITIPIQLSNASFKADGVPMIVNGVVTLAGWISYIEGVLEFGAYGLSGGLAAWSVWYVTSPKNKSAA
jgi:hypothetical protein